ncbi:MAG: HAD family phosphatase [Cyclobacteriaceae bacterium]|nr:HAD family phosphatase [Cyclobacteriaceae bacterium]
MSNTVGFLFDMDGVLVDSNPSHKIALKQFCLQHGFDLTEEQLREKIYGRTNKDWIPNLFGNLSPELVKQYADEKEALFRDIYKNDIKPVDGLIDFLEKLDSNQIARAIATSAPRENVDFTLQYTHIEKYFMTILDESFVSKGKPNPEIYLKTAAALGIAPERCIVFEDSLSGVKAGKDAGCKVVGITTTHTAEELHETDFIIQDFRGLNPKEFISTLF